MVELKKDIDYGEEVVGRDEVFYPCFQTQNLNRDKDSLHLEKKPNTGQPNRASLFTSSGISLGRRGRGLGIWLGSELMMDGGQDLKQRKLGNVGEALMTHVGRPISKAGLG